MAKPWQVRLWVGVFVGLASTLALGCEEEEDGEVVLVPRDSGQDPQAADVGPIVRDAGRSDAASGPLPNDAALDGNADPPAGPQTDAGPAAADGAPPMPADGAMPPPDGAPPPPPPDGALPPPDAAMPPPADGAMPPPPDGAMPPPRDGAMPPPPDGAMAPPGDGAMPPPPDGAMPRPDGAVPPADGAAPFGDAAAPASDAAAYDPGIGDASPVDGGTCSLTDDTYATSTVNPAGCRVLVRDASDCVVTRQAAGLSGFWLRFSCRVTLADTGSAIQAVTDDLPDYKSNYFESDHACHESYTGAIQNPNTIASKHVTIQFPRAPNTIAGPMTGAIVGLALNGVVIFANFAAPGDDIYQEAATFDRCGAHPQAQGTYHYHSEPYSLSYDDANLIGVMRDGYPIYGRRDWNGTQPTDLDAYGGHTSITVDSLTPTYHYHVNEQTSTNAGSAGQKQWFLTKGSYRGSTGMCTGCQ